MYFTNFRTGLVEVINVSFEPDIGDWIILNHSSRIGNDVWKHLVMCYTVLYYVILCYTMLYCVYYLTWASFIVSSEIKGTRVVLVGDFNAVNHVMSIINSWISTLFIMLNQSWTMFLLKQYINTATYVMPFTKCSILSAQNSSHSIWRS